MAIAVSQLNYYPVKSCAGISLTTAQIGINGFEHDREWAILDAQAGSILTQRQIAKLCLIKPDVLKNGEVVALKIAGDERPGIEVAIADGKEIETSFPWGPVCRGLDQGDDAAEWLSAYLGRASRLLRFSPNYVRIVNQEFATRDTDQTAYADDFAFLLLSEESLEELNSYMKESLPMNRFRPNIVVKGTSSYAEDSWKKIRIGNVVFDVVHPCGRCVITTVNQDDASKGGEPLHTLALTRKINNSVPFGMHLAHQTQGFISLGDEVEILD